MFSVRSNVLANIPDIPCEARNVRDVDNVGLTNLRFVSGFVNSKKMLEVLAEVCFNFCQSRSVS